MSRLIHLFICIVISCSAISMQTREDSLLKVLSGESVDSNKTDILHALVKDALFRDPEKALKFSAMLRNHGLHSGDLIVAAEGLKYAGIAYSLRSELKTSQLFFEAAYAYSLASGNKKTQAGALNNIGEIYRLKGNLPVALDYYLRSVRLKEEVGDMPGVAGTLNNIGLLHWEMNEYREGLEYHKRALAIRDTLNMPKQLAESHNNLGLIYQSLKEDSLASTHFNKALKIRLTIGDMRGIAGSLNNLGDIYLRKNDSLATSYFEQALLKYREAGETRNIAGALANLAEIFFRYNKTTKGIEYCMESDQIIRKIDDIMLKKKVCECMYKSYELMARYDLANQKLKELMVLKDSISSQDKSKEVLRKEMSFDHDKELMNVRLDQEKKDINHEKDKTLQRYVIAFIILALIIVLVFLSMYVNRFLLVRKQKKIIEESSHLIEEKNRILHVQKESLEEKNKEILDSINYAKRIQSALLTSEGYITNHLKKDFFVFYKPKDIVSGDFYWAIDHGNKFYMITADCTGHGVPGAFMSMLNISFLNEMIFEKGIESPGLILDSVRKEIIKALNPEGSTNEGRDGMDCTLWVYDSDTGSLSFSMANNPLWIVTKDPSRFPEGHVLYTHDDNHLVEFRPDKMPVGLQEDMKAFSTTTIKVDSGDSIFCFTDGYADQFGGPKGKKFKYKPFAQLICETTQLKPKNQKVYLSKVFNEWKGDLEQVDDVLVTCVRL